MKSVRATLTCIGIGPGGDASVLGDLFGFFLRRVPTDPDTTVTASVSLTSHLQGLAGKHVHLNLISVGLDTLSAAAQQTALQKIDYAVYRARNIYRAASLGVGRVLHYEILFGDANGRDDLGSEDEADDLSDEWSVPNDGVDIFLVRNISDSDFVGVSPRPGDCDKGDKDDGMIGGEVNRGSEGFSRTMAHELGHFLDLSHNHDDDSCPSTTAGQNNLMAQSKCAISLRTSILLTSSQGSTVRGRCQVRDGC